MSQIKISSEDIPLTAALDADAARGGALLLALLVEARLEVTVHLPLGHVRPELGAEAMHSDIVLSLRI